MAKTTKLFKQQGKNIHFVFRSNNMVMKREASPNKMGEVINLYQDTGKDLKFIKIVGWLQDDTKNGCNTEKSIIKGLTNVDNCKLKVIPYLESLFS